MTNKRTLASRLSLPATPLPTQLPRRSFLRAGAVTIALPFLDAMLPAGARAAAPSKETAPKRMLLSVRALGTNDQYLFPKETGPKYKTTRYLKILEKHREKFTVFSGMSHLGYPNSHHTEAGLLTGVEGSRMQRGDDISATISLDQYVAEHIGRETRFPYLFMGTHNTGSLAGLSYNRSGVIVPGETNANKVFTSLFINSSPEEIQKELRRLDDGRSILDGVRDQLGALRRDLGVDDRTRLDVFASAIRDAEITLKQNQDWIAKPKPKVDRTAKDFSKRDWSSIQNIYFDLAFLALQTDSTRTVLVREPEGGAGNAPGATIGQHDASHHGQDPAKIEQFAKFEEEETRNFSGLLDKLESVTEGNGTLLDHTQVLWASNIGNPSAHASNNLPILLAGGGYKHQGHVAFDRKKNAPLTNLYVRMLNQMDIPAKKFGASTGVAY